MAPNASTSSQHRDPGGLPAPASTRGLPALASTCRYGVATYNIGARTDEMFSGPQKQPQFERKLREDLEKLCTKTCIICLQEVSPSWRNTIVGLVPAWQGAYDEGTTLLTLWSTARWTQAKDATTLEVFPDSTAKHRWWRRCFAVALRLRETGDIISVVNCHTIDGQGDRSISGSRDNFTKAALQGSVMAAQRFRMDLAATKVKGGFLVMGDFNTYKRNATNALRLMPAGTDHFACDGYKNNFIISNNTTQTLREHGPLSHDTQHTAVRVELELLKVEEPRVHTDATADKARDIAQGRAAQILKSLYDIVAKRIMQEHEQEEKEEPVEASQRRADEGEQAEANQRVGDEGSLEVKEDTMEDQTEEATAGQAKEEVGRAKEEAASQAGLLVVVAVAPPLVVFAVFTAVVATTTPTDYHYHNFSTATTVTAAPTTTPSRA